MNEYIKKLQSKGEDVRKQILTGSLIVAMSFVAFVWISSLDNKFNKEKIVAQADNEEVRPFKLFANSIGDAYENISASVGNVWSKDKKIINISTEKQIDLTVVETPTN